MHELLAYPKPSTWHQGRAQSLDATRCLLKKLHILQPKIPVVSVAGTNGKGSCVAALASIYQAAGYRVGAFISPHLLCITERITINNKPIRLLELERYCDRIAGVSSQTITFFECLLACALLAFQHHEVDIILLEVGLGGRLDAVNCLDADVSVITSIAKDHQEILGHSLEAIGREKAGIMRANRPTVYGERSPVRSVLQYAAALGSRLYVYGEHYPQEPHDFAAHAKQTIKLLQTRLLVSDKAIQQGLSNVTRRARHELQDNILFDVAHNPAACERLAQHLKQHYAEYTIIAVWSMMGNKDLQASITPLQSCIDTWYCAPLLRAYAATSSALQDALKAINANYQCWVSVQQAFSAAKQAANDKTLILVFGSFYTVAKLYRPGYNPCHQ